MSLARRTRPLRVALGAIVLASPLALTLGVRSGRLTPVPPLAEGDVWGLVTSLLALLARAHVRGRPDLRVVGGAA